MKKKLNRYVLAEEVYKIIKKQILSQELEPGEKINIDQLARDLEVSNIPIREALSRLVSEGLVEMVPFKGMFVTKMTLHDLEELFELRIHLETLAVEKAVLRIPEEELKLLKHDMETFSGVLPGNNDEFLQYVVRMNEALHGLILKYCGNNTLRNLVLGYIERIQGYLVFIQKNLNVDISRDEWQEHALILQRLFERDAAGAADAMRQHLIHARERTKRFFS